MAQGRSDRVLAPGESLHLDAHDFVLELGAPVPSPADANFYLSWQVRHPYPPIGIDLQFSEAPVGSRLLIATGTSGQFTRAACVAFEIVNNSAVELAVQLRYGFDALATQPSR